MVEPTGGPFFLCHLSYAVGAASVCPGGVEGPASAFVSSAMVIVDLTLAGSVRADALDVAAAATALVFIRLSYNQAAVSRCYR